jgi:hypothetical protein
MPAPRADDPRALLRAALERARRRDDPVRAEVERRLAAVVRAVRPVRAAPVASSSDPLPLPAGVPEGRGGALAALARTLTASDRAAFAELARQRRAMAELARAHRQLRAHVAKLQEEADATVRALAGDVARLLRGLRRAERAEARGAASARAFRARAAREQRALRAALRGQETAAYVEKVNGIVNGLQGAAYGDAGALFTRNNLRLAGNQLAWTLVDPVLRRIGVWAGPGVSPLALLAPLGSLATAHAALSGRQHVRFLSGVTVIPGVAPSPISHGSGSGSLPLKRIERVSLVDRIGRDDLDAFRSRDDVVVSAHVIGEGPKLLLSARVESGVLILEVYPSTIATRVAWMVDTGFGRE